MKIQPKKAAAARSKSSTSGSVSWGDAATEFTKRCAHLQIYGETGTGRTTLALSAPGPIAILHANEKLEGIIEPFAHKIGPHGDGTGGVFNFGGVFKGKKDDIATQASRIMADFVAHLDDAYTWARSIVIDTHTELWELLRLARFGTLTPKGVIAHLYGPVNAEYSRLINDRYRSQETVNLITIGKIKEEYRKDKATGRMVVAGHKNAEYFSDVSVLVEKEDGVFTTTIKKGWLNAAVEGVPLEDQDFGSIMELTTETPRGEWE